MVKNTLFIINDVNDGLYKHFIIIVTKISTGKIQSVPRIKKLILVGFITVYKKVSIMDDNINDHLRSLTKRCHQPYCRQFPPKIKKLHLL